MKDLMYGTPVDPIDYEEGLISRISVAASRVQDVPRIFEHVRASMLLRCHACIATGGQHFEQLLQQLC